MCQTNFTILTYNTHLFGPAFEIFSKVLPTRWTFHDGDRKVAINHTYLENSPPPSQITGLQEVWSSEYADSFITDLARANNYTNHYVRNDDPITVFNPSGLLLLAAPQLTFHHKEDFNYIKHCDKDGWSLQDIPSMKGYLRVECDFPCSDNPGETHSLGLWTTHMPTSYGDHHKSVSCCFSTLADRVTKFRQSKKHSGTREYDKCAVFVFGDLNIASDNHKGEYDALVDRYLIQGAGLIDAAAEAAQAGADPGNTIDPATNNLWQYFNDTDEGRAERIDYVLYANSGDGSMTVAPNNIFSFIPPGGGDPIPTNVLVVRPDPPNDMQLLLAVDGTEYNCSDHYPLLASFQVSVAH